MIDWLKTRLIQIVQWLIDLAKEVFSSAWDMVKDAFSWCFDQVLDVAISALGALDLSGLNGYTASWGALPGEIVNVMGLLGAGQAAGIIAAAVVIRLILQLIPFTRLGS